MAIRGSKNSRRIRFRRDCRRRLRRRSLARAERRLPGRGRSNHLWVFCRRRSKRLFISVTQLDAATVGVASGHETCCAGLLRAPKRFASKAIRKSRRKAATSTGDDSYQQEIDVRSRAAESHACGRLRMAALEWQPIDPSRGPCNCTRRIHPEV